MSASKVAEARLQRSEARRKAYSSAASSSSTPLEKPIALTPLASLSTYELPKVLQLHGQSPAVAEWFAWKLRTLGTSDIKIMAQRGGVGAVLSAMRAHPSLVAVQEDGCGALARFAACDSEVRAEMLRQHCVSEIEAAMRLHRGEPECQEAALSALAALSAGDLPSEGAIVSSSSCLHLVAEAMRTHPHRLDLQHSGCSLLYYLAAGSDEGRSAVVAARGIDAVASAMRFHSSCLPLLSDGCGALCSLASSMDMRTVSAVIAARAVDVIVEAMLTAPANHTHLQTWGCVAIASIAHGEGAEAYLRPGVEAPAGMALIEQERSFDALPPRLYGGSSPGSRRARGRGTGASSSDRVRAVVRAMRAQPDEATLVEQGCGAIWSIAASGEVGRRAAIGDKGETVLLLAMSQHPTLPSIQEQASGALCALCVTDSEMHARAVRSGALALASSALAQHESHGGVQRRACALLAILAAFDSEAASAAVAMGAPSLAVGAIAAHPADPGILRTASALLLAAWPFDEPSSAENGQDDAPTGGMHEGGGDPSAAGAAQGELSDELAELVDLAVETVVRSLTAVLGSRPRELWFVPWVNGTEVPGQSILGGASLSNAIEPAFALLSQLASRGDPAARARAMVSLGLLPLLADALLEASEGGLRLPHGQELGGIMAHAAQIEELEQRRQQQQGAEGGGDGGGRGMRMGGGGARSRGLDDEEEVDQLGDEGVDVDGAVPQPAVGVVEYL